MTNLPQVTTVPTVVTALLTAFAAIPSDAAYGTLEVWDGPAFSSQAHDLIAVGVGSPSITHALVRQNRGVAYDESYDITCLHWAWSGSYDMAQHRARCVTVLSAVRAAVDALDIPLAVLRLSESLQWTQAVSGEGASCSVQFAVHVAASL